MRLAHKYHGQNVRFLSVASSIHLFKEPPDWALRATMHSDWALKKHNRALAEFEKEYGNRETVTETIYPRAAIACGIGPDGESESKRRFWRRKRLQISVVAIGIVAVLCGSTNDRNQYVLGASTIKHTAKVVINRVGSTLEVGTFHGFSNFKLKRERTIRVQSDSKPPCKNGEHLKMDETDKDASFSRMRPAKLAREIAESARIGLADEAQVVIL